MFVKYEGPVGNLPTNEQHVHYRWDRENCNILFSATQQGQAMSCHVASDKQGLRKLKLAIDEFCEFIFGRYTWCTMILAKVDKVNRASIKRVLLKIGFEQLVETEDTAVLIRRPK